MNDEGKIPRFYYLQKVSIGRGFYRGHTGIVLGYIPKNTRYSELNSDAYLVKIETWKEIETHIDESDLCPFESVFLDGNERTSARSNLKLPLDE